MKTDARVRYTRMRIQEAFFACLEEKPVNKITVKELCDLAEINRATFYKHYADPFDLMEKMEEETLAELRRLIGQSKTDRADNMLVTVLGETMGEPKRCALLASANGDPGFAARMAEMFYESFRPRIAKALPGRSEAEVNAAYFFVAGGSGSLLSRWFQSGMAAPIEEVVASLNEICEAFVRGYAHKSPSIWKTT